ncbi:MAG: DJ-1/PfpI family protein [Proteobacteria bacterium]|nr:DJ-1/PfpI family protein [Pseudomonadota bacterium]
MSHIAGITPKRSIEILAFPEAQLLDITGPLQVFASANEWAAAAGLATPYQVRVVARSQYITTSSGLTLVAVPLPRHTAPLDTLVIAGGGGIRKAVQDAVLMRWLSLRAARARRVVSICTGAFLAAAAGLLTGRSAVTHWRDCAELASRNPSTRVESDPIYVRDGQFWSSAGVTAGIDLSLALVEEDVGHDIAMAVARDLVVFLKRPGGQAQFSQVLALQASDVRFGRLHAWMAEHLASDLSVPALAVRAGMSERTFVRHYRAATGHSPARAVERLRVEAAQRLLAGSRLSIKSITRRCGFGSKETMRQSFQRQLAVAPREFRARFAANLPRG